MYPAVAVPRRSHPVLWFILASLVALIMVAGLTGAVMLVYLHRPVDAIFVPGDGALRALLDRRAKAVIGHDEQAFLADVDSGNSSLVRRERDEYHNLQALGLASFTLTLEPVNRFGQLSSVTALAGRYHGRIRAVAVTIRYAVAGLDAAPVAEPWVPVFGYAGGRWLLAGEADDAGLPDGTGGLPWEANPITVLRGAHVAAVVSAADAAAGRRLLDRAERAVTKVLTVRPTGWSAKVLVTAVSDESVFDSYFRGDPGRLAETAAIAVPTYDRVPMWMAGPQFVTSRVVFNPDSLGRLGELDHDLTHEFAHVAMGPLTARATPLWLVEGFAEYLAYRTDDDPPSVAAVAQAVHKLSVTALPSDVDFYDKPDNYLLGWQACAYLAQHYGQTKLLAFYAAFHADGTGEAPFHDVLGTTSQAFTTGWLRYLSGLA